MSKENIYRDVPIVMHHEAQPNIVMGKERKMDLSNPIEVTKVREDAWLKESLKSAGEIIKRNRITLSAAKTVEKDKAIMDIISCRHIFPETPSVQFLNDRTDFFGGKIYFYLKNLQGPKKLQVTIRIKGLASGGATIRMGSSLPTTYSLNNIVTNGSMNFVLGNIIEIPASVQSLELYTIEVQFHNAMYGSWEFTDCRFQEVS
jgi:hypothetical protein